MNYRILLLSMSASFLLLLVGKVTAQTDYFTSGFYTRGADTAYYMDKGDAIIDPFYVPVQEWSLLPRLTLTATHDDNIFLSSNDEEAATTVDFIPGVLVIYGRPENNHLYADFSTIIPLYDSSDELSDDPSYLLTLGGIYRTGKSQVSGNAGYRRSENADTLVGARIVEEDYVGNLGLEHRISTKTSVGANGSVEFHDYDEESYYDYNRYYGAGRLYYRMTAKSEGFLQLGAGRDDVDAPEDNGDADFYDVSLGLRGKQSAKTSVSGRVGYMWREYDNEESESVDHWIASLAADTTPFGLTTFNAEVTADIRPAINSLGTSAVNQRFLLGANRRLFYERLRGNAAVYYGYVDYYGTDAQPVDPESNSDLVYDGREDEYWGFSLGLDWWTRKNLSVGLTYSYTENLGSRNGSDEEQDITSYESGRWVLRVSWNY